MLHICAKTVLPLLRERDGHVTKQSVSCSSHMTTSPSELHQQNEQLKAVIADMRREMEQVSAKSTSHTAEHSDCEEGVVLSRGYMKHLEQELVRVTAENRRLRAGEVPGLDGKSSGKPPAPAPHHDKLPGPSPPSARHRSHLVALSDTISALQREKTALELRGVWLEGRARDLGGALKQAQEEVRIRDGGRDVGRDGGMGGRDGGRDVGRDGGRDVGRDGEGWGEGCRERCGEEWGEGWGERCGEGCGEGWGEGCGEGWGNGGRDVGRDGEGGSVIYDCGFISRPTS